MLADVKRALRISHNSLDEEVTMLINAAKTEMKRAGIHQRVIDSTNDLVKLSIITYCKANFGLDNDDSEKYMNSFNSMLSAMCLSDEYLQEIVQSPVSESDE